MLRFSVVLECWKFRYLLRVLVRGFNRGYQFFDTGSSGPLIGLLDLVASKQGISPPGVLIGCLAFGFLPEIPYFFMLLVMLLVRACLACFFFFWVRCCSVVVSCSVLLLVCC